MPLLRDLRTGVVVEVDEAGADTRLAYRTADGDPQYEKVTRKQLEREAEEVPSDAPSDDGAADSGAPRAGRRSGRS